MINAIVAQAADDPRLEVRKEPASRGIGELRNCVFADDLIGGQCENLSSLFSQSFAIAHAKMAFDLAGDCSQVMRMQITFEPA